MINNGVRLWWIKFLLCEKDKMRIFLSGDGNCCVISMMTLRFLKLFSWKQEKILFWCRICLWHVIFVDYLSVSEFEHILRTTELFILNDESCGLNYLLWEFYVFMNIISEYDVLKEYCRGCIRRRKNFVSKNISAYRK